MPRSADIADIIEFEKDFWLAQKEYFESHGKPLSDSPAYNRALSRIKKRDWKWASTLLEANSLFYSRKYSETVQLLKSLDKIPPECQGLRHYLLACAFLELGMNDDVILHCNKCIDDENFTKTSHAQLPLGVALTRRGFFDEAKKVFEKTLDDEAFERPRNTWNYIGNLETKRFNFDKALAAYQKALECEGVIGDESIWYNIGTTYLEMDDLDAAIEAYNESLKSPLEIHRSVIFNALGNIYQRKRDYANAVISFKKSLGAPKPEKIAIIQANLGTAYAEWGKKREARSAFKKALKADDPTGRTHERARLALDVLSGKLQPNDLAPDLRKRLESNQTTNTFHSGFNKILRDQIDAAKGGTKYKEYMELPSSILNNCLIIMRGWSSALPLLGGVAQASRGGGYFIKWRGYGLVLDPGIDFVRNMRELGVHAREINAVVVSHNHTDHQHDLRAIDDLRYELYRRRESGTKNNIMPYVLISDQDTPQSLVFAAPDPEHRWPPISLSAGRNDKFELSTHDSRLPFTLNSFKVEHGDDVPGALGYVIELIDENNNPAIRIGYTGDTKFFKKLPGHFKNCDVLIAHISQPDIEEFGDNPEFKKAHLGYLGVKELIKSCKPDLSLIGEFWAGIDDLRINLTKGICIEIPNQPIFPTAIGMTVNLQGNSIRCTICKNWVPHTEIRVTPPTEPYGPLGYLCPNCIFPH